mmetsp:Transcript_15797/g.37768  ORF Transcript_15797/g.37768 Transcript_15797/m.37768 type:complete len:200 (-) Transcript_15797:730-1329(-)
MSSMPAPWLPLASSSRQWLSTSQKMASFSAASGLPFPSRGCSPMRKATLCSVGSSLCTTPTLFPLISTNFAVWIEIPAPWLPRTVLPRILSTELEPNATMPESAFRHTSLLTISASPRWTQRPAAWLALISLLQIVSALGCSQGPMPITPMLLLPITLFALRKKEPLFWAVTPRLPFPAISFPSTWTKERASATRTPVC